MIQPSDRETLAQIIRRSQMDNQDPDVIDDMVDEVVEVIEFAGRHTCGGVMRLPERHSINGLCAAITLVAAAELMLRQAGIEMELPVPAK